MKYNRHYSNRFSFEGIGSIIFLAVWFLGAIGWVMNIVDIVTSIDSPITRMFVFRIVGVFVFPIGMVLGWF